MEFEVPDIKERNVVPALHSNIKYIIYSNSISLTCNFVHFGNTYNLYAFVHYINTVHIKQPLDHFHKLFNIVSFQILVKLNLFVMS